MTQNTILAVDDEPFNLEILEEILSDDYIFNGAASGPECLAVAGEMQPDVILLDVSMPNMDGYEVCRRLKNSPDTKDIPVMFVSARGALDERIEGYNAGGEDYIVKPFAREELEAKLKGLFKMQDHQKDLESQVQQATELAFSAMSNSSEIGVVMQFVERTSTIDSIDGLCQALLETLSGYGLSACIELRMQGQESHHACSQGSVSPIIIELFDLLKNKGRIYSFEPRMMINFRQISILLLNMPQGDEDRIGRLRDHLCFVGSSAEQCLSALMTESALLNQRMALQKACSLVRSKFEELAWVLNESHRQNEAIFKELQEHFEEKIPTMGLDEDQELYIYRSLDAAIQKSVAREDQVMEIKQTFGEIEADLSALLND